MIVVHRSPLRRGRFKTWLRLAYSQSFADRPARMTLRFVRQAADPVAYVLPAAGFGRNRWLGPIPPDTTCFEILAPADRPHADRIDRVARLSAMTVAAQILTRNPARLPGFVLALLRAPQRTQALRALAALDVAPLDALTTMQLARARAVDACGFDKPPADPGRITPLHLFMLAHEDRPGALVETLASLAAQTDPGFRLVLLVPQTRAASTNWRSHGRFVEAVVLPDHAVCEQELLRRACASPEAWVARLRAGEVLRPEAVLAVRAELARRPRADFAYTDSAVRAGGGAYPHLKPDWSPCFQAGHDYVDQWLLARPAALRDLAAASGRAPIPSWSALLRSSRPDLRVHHVRRVLITVDPAAPDRGAAPVRAPAPIRAKATIVIPMRDRLDLIERAVASIEQHTPAGTYEIVVVDNASSEPDCLAYLARLERQSDRAVLRDAGAFNFSRLVNAGARHGRGDILVLLNNDCAALHADWLAPLVARAAEPGIGAVGAKLLYDDGTLQHAGVGIGLGGEAGHRNRARPGDHAGYLGRLRHTHEVSAVTGACLVVARAAFERVGGFDERFAVAFNDIDFCLKLADLGLRNLLVPDVVLRHSESLSRGSDQHPSRRARWQGEAALFRERWQRVILDDPYLHPQLCLWRFDEMLH